MIDVICTEFYLCVYIFIYHHSFYCVFQSGLYCIVGNIGYNPVYPEYDMESSCNATRTFSGSNHGYNGTCIHVFNTEFKLPEVAGLLTFFEIIQILVFFCFIFHLQRVTNTIKIAREKELCSVSDYSIIVRKIPADTTKEQLISHFNALYPLDEKDWLGRPPLGERERGERERVCVCLCDRESVCVCVREGE